MNLDAFEDKPHNTMLYTIAIDIGWLTMINLTEEEKQLISKYNDSTLMSDKLKAIEFIALKIEILSRKMNPSMTGNESIEKK